MRAFEEAGNADGISTTLNNLGILHRERNDLESAAEAFERTLRIAQKREDDKLIAHALSNLAAVYMEAEDRERALEVILEARDLKLAYGQLVVIEFWSFECPWSLRLLPRPAAPLARSSHGRCPR